MTLKWPWTTIMRSVAIHACLSEPITKIWMKIDPYYPQQKCSPGIAVSDKIRLMRIFAGVRSRVGNWCLQRTKVGNFHVRCTERLPEEDHACQGTYSRREYNKSGTPQRHYFRYAFCTCVTWRTMTARHHFFTNGKPENACWGYLVHLEIQRGWPRARALN